MKKILNTKNAPAAIGSYSQAVEYNGFLFISGQIPLIPSTGKLVDGGIEEQVEQVMQNIAAILKSNKLDFSMVLKCTCYLIDINQFDSMNRIYSTYFPVNPPARVVVEVSNLPKGSLIEIDAIAGS